MYKGHTPNVDTCHPCKSRKTMINIRKIQTWQKCPTKHMQAWAILDCCSTLVVEKYFPQVSGSCHHLGEYIYIFLNEIISISTSLLWQKGEKVMNSANITVKLSLQFLLWAPCELGIFLFIFQKIYLVGHMHSQSFDANLQCIEECFVTIPTKPCKKTQRYSTPFHTYTDPRLWSPDL